MLEGPHVFPDGGGKVLCLHKPHVLAAGVGQNVAEGMHPAAPFGRESDVVGRIVHLCWHSWTRLKSPHGQFRRTGPQRPQPVPHDRVATLEAEPAQLLVQADRRDVRIALQQLGNVIGEWVQHAGTSPALPLHPFCPVLFVTHQHTGHAVAGDSQQFGDAALRSTAVVQADDLVACRFPHARSSSLTKSRLNAATDPASRASLWKRGSKITRSSGVSPVRPWCASHTSMRPSTSSNIPTRFHTWLPASLSRGSRTAGSTPLACESASRGCARTYSCWRRSEHRSQRSTTPPNSALDSASRRMASSTSVWLPCGNRTICRAAVGVNKPTRSSSFAFGPNRSISASRRHTQLLWRPNSSATSTWLNPSSRTSAWIIQASSSSRVRPPARFSP